MIALYLAAGILAAAEQPAVKRGGDDAPAVYDEKVEQKRRERVRKREEDLENAIRTAWNRAKGIATETEQAVIPAVLPKKVTPKRAREIAAALSSVPAFSRDQELAELIARIARQAQSLEALMRQAKVSALIEEEAIVMLLAA